MERIYFDQTIKIFATVEIIIFINVITLSETFFSLSLDVLLQLSLTVAKALRWMLLQ